MNPLGTAFNYVSFIQFDNVFVRSVIYTSNKYIIKLDEMHLNFLSY